MSLHNPLLNLDPSKSNGEKCKDNSFKICVWGWKGWYFSPCFDLCFWMFVKMFVLPLETAPILCDLFCVVVVEYVTLKEWLNSKAIEKYVTQKKGGGLFYPIRRGNYSQYFFLHCLTQHNLISRLLAPYSTDEKKYEIIHWIIIEIILTVV